ncbi:MAG TPA: hypothetical protein VGS96_10595, partial [Thermoanaerobaculia bacterium]|nr:hypothetical protein [Thermoanaerobaculia bacterium]
MPRLYFLIALAVSLALPAAAQQSCDLQIRVACTNSSNNTACTSTTLNAGSNVCTGEFLSGYYVVGAGKVAAFANSLALGDCFDSSLFPQPGVSYIFCFGTASLHPGGQFTASATITGGGGEILGFTGVWDENFETQKALVYAQANV